MYEQIMNNDVTLTGDDKPPLAGRYQIVRQLGTGGMGSVWLVKDRQLDNKLFAVKMLPSVLVSNKRAYRQLKDEALVAMKLVHPNIVQIRAFEENDGNPFLVMDYIEGQTLDDYLAEKGKLSENETVRLLGPIAEALDYAHGVGVVHRDVKPANVMIRNDGHPYILDFGIAREIQETMTRVTGKLLSGTLLYMSPEQLRGQQPKAAQDVYSFAAMAYECLKGEPPFPRGQIEYQILNERPEPLPDCVKLSVPIMRGLSKKPENRPDLCAKVLLAVSSIKPSTQARTQPYTVPTRSMPPAVVKSQSSRKINMSGIAVPVVCVLMVLVVLGGVMRYRESGYREESRSRAVAAQHGEAARLQREESQVQDAVRTRAQEEQLAEHKKADENRKAKAEVLRIEEENKSRERELPRQKDEEFRETEETKRTAIAAKEKSDKMVLQNARMALESLADDPWQYESVSIQLAQEQREVLAPLFREIVSGDAEIRIMLESYTEANPAVKEKRLQQNYRISQFKAVVNSIQNAGVPVDSTSFVLPTERFESYIVKAGDTFANIARSHGSSVRALKELNGLDDYRLRVGQVLTVPIKAGKSNIAMAETPKFTWNSILEDTRSRSKIAAATRGGVLFGDAMTESRVVGALRWLRTQQNNDGSWGDKFSPQLTAVAVLAYLAHGEAPSRENQYESEFATTIKNGLEYLVAYIKRIETQPSANYNDDLGYIYATQALCEAYGLTADEKYCAVAGRGLIGVLKRQLPDGSFESHPDETAPRLIITALSVQTLHMGLLVGVQSKDVKDSIVKGLDFLRNADYRSIPQSARRDTIMRVLATFAYMGVQTSAVLDRALEDCENVSPALGRSINLSASTTLYLYCSGMRAEASQESKNNWAAWNGEMKRQYLSECIASTKKVKDANGKERMAYYWDHYFDGHGKVRDDVISATCLVAFQFMVYYRVPMGFTFTEAATKL